MVASRVLVVAAVFFGLFAPLQARVGPYELHAVDIYDSARQFLSASRTLYALGVAVHLNLTYPRLLVDGENFTFAYRLVTGDAPAGWKLNITRIELSGDCIQRVTRVVNTVLTGRQQLTGQFNVKIAKGVESGYTGRCDVYIRLGYSAVFGENRDTSTLSVSAYIPVKSRELPLKLDLDIQGVKKSKYGEGYVFNASIRVRNGLKGDITITSLKYCPHDYESSPEKIIGCSWNTKTLSSMILKPGEEGVITYEGVELNDKSRHVAFVVQYLYAGGRAENWLVLKVVKVAATGGVVGTETMGGETTPKRAVTGTGMAPGAPRLLDVITWLVGLLILFAIAYPVVKWRRSEPSVPDVIPSPTPVSLPPPEPKTFRLPDDFNARCTAIRSTFLTAHTYYFRMYDERAGVRALFDAVNSLLNLILEAEDISFKRLDNPHLEISMREKVRLLASRGWISPSTANYFIRLQTLRNMVSHSHEKIHLKLTRPDEVSGLFNFFANYIPDTLARLRSSLGLGGRLDEKPGGKGPSYIG